MKILLAEDEAVSRKLLAGRLRRAGHSVVDVADGHEAWRVLAEADAPALSVLDWMMPGIEGVEICRQLRSRPDRPYVYVILVTARTDKSDVVAGLDAGADDFLSKPYDFDELMSRLRVGERILGLERGLAAKVSELSAALEQVKLLQGFLPICMHCKRVRDTTDRWQQIENYIEAHSQAVFSHGLCVQCLEKHYPETAAEVAAERQALAAASQPAAADQGTST